MGFAYFYFKHRGVFMWNKRGRKSKYMKLSDKPVKLENIEKHIIEKMKGFLHG